MIPNIQYPVFLFPLRVFSTSKKRRTSQAQARSDVAGGGGQDRQEMEWRWQPQAAGGGQSTLKESVVCVGVIKGECVSFVVEMGRGNEEKEREKGERTKRKKDQKGWNSTIQRMFWTVFLERKNCFYGGWSCSLQLYKSYRGFMGIPSKFLLLLN